NSDGSGTGNCGGTRSANKTFACVGRNSGTRRWRCTAGPTPVWPGGTATMTPALFDQLVETPRRQPLPLSRLHDFARDAGSRWSAEQLRLFLECIDGVTVASEADPQVGLGERSARDELADAILEIVRGRGGRPVPAQ